MKHIFLFDENKCCACGACVVGCLDQNDTDLAAGDRPFRRTYDDEVPMPDGSEYCVYMSSACHHCDDAPCIAACPVGCISKDPETGFTVYDNTNCIGCKSCALACPFGAPTYRHADGKMVKCDGCNIRVKNGLLPACVRACSFGALRCLSEDEYKKELEAKAHSKLLKDLSLK